MADLGPHEPVSSIHFLSTFPGEDRSLAHRGTRLFNSYQMRFGASSPRLAGYRGSIPGGTRNVPRSALLQPEQGTRVVPSWGLAAYIDPKSAAAKPTLQVRLIGANQHFQPIPDKTQVRHRFRGRVLSVADNLFRAVLESRTADSADYVVDVPLTDLHESQRDFVEPDAEFGLFLIVRQGPNFQRVIDREFVFDQEVDILPDITPELWNRAKRAADEQRDVWDAAERAFDDDFEADR
jgi:hypothetical protein